MGKYLFMHAASMHAMDPVCSLLLYCTCTLPERDSSVRVVRFRGLSFHLSSPYPSRTIILLLVLAWSLPLARFLYVWAPVPREFVSPSDRPRVSHVYCGHAHARQKHAERADRQRETEREILLSLCLVRGRSGVRTRLWAGGPGAVSKERTTPGRVEEQVVAGRRALHW